MRKFAVAIAASAAILAGCASEEVPPQVSDDRTEITIISDWTTLDSLGTERMVFLDEVSAEITLLCVATDGWKSGGVSCLPVTDEQARGMLRGLTR